MDALTRVKRKTIIDYLDKSNIDDLDEMRWIINNYNGKEKRDRFDLMLKWREHHGKI